MVLAHLVEIILSVAVLTLELLEAGNLFLRGCPTAIEACRPRTEKMRHYGRKY